MGRPTKAWTGPNVFDCGVHWTIDDFKLRKDHATGGWVLWVRFKAIKQDMRLERPSLAGSSRLPVEDDADHFGHDWVPIGDIPGTSFSVAAAFQDCVRQLGRQRKFKVGEPMFFADVLPEPAKGFAPHCMIVVSA